MPAPPPRDPSDGRHLHVLEAPPPDDYPDDPHDRRPPHDVAAERAVLGSILRSRHALDEVSQTLTGTDFYRPAHEAIYDAALHLYARLEPVDAITVADRLAATNQLDRIGGHSYLATLTGGVASPASATYYARIVAEKAALRRLVEAGTRLTQLGYAAPGGDVESILNAAQAELATVATRGIPGIEPSSPGQTLDEFLAGDDDEEPDWLIPDFLERRDRLIVTAAEGGGKSTLLRQWAIQAALGEHPFTGTRHAPAKVLLVDLENSDRQIRRALRPLRLAARDINPSNLIIVCKGDGLDLTTAADLAWLDKVITHHKPDLLVTGPIYKLAGGNPNDEVDAKPAALAIDTMRAKHDLAVILEAHTRKGESTNPKHRPKEPFGWSGWMRWPEFGIHISADGDVTHWRGKRDADRQFPELLLRGGKWPWMPAQSPDEARFHQIRQLVQDAGEVLSNREIARRLDLSEAMVRRILGPRRQQWQAIVARIRIESGDDS